MQQLVHPVERVTRRVTPLLPVFFFVFASLAGLFLSFERVNSTNRTTLQLSPLQRSGIGLPPALAGNSLTTTFSSDWSAQLSFRGDLVRGDRATVHLKNFDERIQYRLTIGEKAVELTQMDTQILLTQGGTVAIRLDEWYGKQHRIYEGQLDVIR